MPTEEPTPEVSPILYYVEMTTPDGSAARFDREMSVADYWIILLLIAILISIWVQYIPARLKGDKKGE